MHNKWYCDKDISTVDDCFTDGCLTSWPRSLTCFPVLLQESHWQAVNACHKWCPECQSWNTASLICGNKSKGNCRRGKYWATSNIRLLLTHQHRWPRAFKFQPWGHDVKSQWEEVSIENKQNHIWKNHTWTPYLEVPTSTMCQPNTNILTLTTACLQSRAQIRITVLNRRRGWL